MSWLHTNSLRSVSRKSTSFSSFLFSLQDTLYRHTLVSHTALPVSLLPCRPRRGLPWRGASPSAVCRRICGALSILLITVLGNVSHCQLREAIAVHMCPFYFTDETTATVTQETAPCAGWERVLAFCGVGGPHVTCGDSFPVLPSFLRCLRSSRGGGGAFCAKYDPSL